MSPVDASDSGEEFGPTPPGSSEEDHEADTEFQPMADTWTMEQLNVLLLRVDDWKASKNVKSQQLVLQGAMTDLSRLPVPPAMDELNVVCRECDLMLLLVMLLSAH
jgi:hypothetical protein